MKSKSKKKSKKEKLKLIGSLGGEVSIFPNTTIADFGYPDLESAKQAIEKDFKPWNNEEEEMLREQIRKLKKH